MLHFQKYIYFSGYYLMFQALKGCYLKNKNKNLIQHRSPAIWETATLLIVLNI